MIRDRLARLEDRMFRLREKLSTAEPENAKRLEAALEQSGTLSVQARAERLVAALRDPGTLDVSIEEQERLVADLEVIMAVLLDRDPNDARRREELARLTEIKENLDRLIQEQSQQRQDAARRVQNERLGKRIAAAHKQLEALKEAQRNLAERTAQADVADPAESQALAPEQEDLRDQAERLRREIEQIARRKSALDPDAPTTEKPNKDSAEAKPQSADSAEESPLGDAAQQVEGAAQDMAKAAEQQRGGQPQSATKEQEAAIEKLQRAIHRLQEAQEKLEEDAESDQAAAEQRRIAQETQRLARRMQPQPADGDNPPQQNGEQGGEQPPQGQNPGSPAPEKSPEQTPQQQSPTPGQENVERAEQHMDDAAERFNKKENDQAILEQDKALDELERAKRELEETLKQLRREEQEEVLASLEARLRDMLQQQTAINQETQPLSALGEANFGRAEALKCAELADRQAEVREAADSSNRLLEEDGTTIVFPNMMQQLAVDMQTIASRLAASQVGPLTTAMQEDVLATLTELLESLARLREKMQEQQRGGGGGGAPSAGAPLVPTSAELKLLKTSQARINRQTDIAQGAGEVDKAGEIGEILSRAARQQAELRDMAREIQQRAEKEGAP